MVLECTETTVLSVKSPEARAGFASVANDKSVKVHIGLADMMDSLTVK